MGLHAYCIVPAGHTPENGLCGVGGAAVRHHAVGGLGVWVSGHEAAPVPGIESVRSHNDVVGAAMTDRVTPVPLRFGQWFDDEAALQERLAADEGKWAERLAALAGYAEFGVTVAAPSSEARYVRAPKAETGAAYMRELAARQADATARRAAAVQISAEIGESVKDVAAETRVETPPGGAVLVRIALLVAWADLDAYHAAVQALRAGRPGLELHLTGPWPPWSFA